MKCISKQVKIHILNFENPSFLFSYENHLYTSFLLFALIQYPLKGTRIQYSAAKSTDARLPYNGAFSCSGKGG